MIGIGIGIMIEIDGTALKEDIMFLGAVCIDAFCWGVVCTGMARWGTERATYGGSTVFCWMSKPPAVLSLTWGRNIRFNLAEGPTYTVWKSLFFECYFCNICWIFVATTRVNGKAKYTSNIMLICSQFKEVRRIVGPTDAHWEYLILNENGISTSAQLSIRGY